MVFKKLLSRFCILRLNALFKAKMKAQKAVVSFPARAGIQFFGLKTRFGRSWIPACAGMTAACKFPNENTNTWIPACAGMTRAFFSLFLLW
jgi:hypothetical protein